jgi:DNA primase
MSDLRELIAKLKPYLRPYLESMGVRIRKDGRFICPSPEKHDSDPSANFVPGSNNTAFWCHGCKSGGDTLLAANWLEGLPLKGPEFIHKTVYGLARRFGIPFEPKEMSERDLQILRLTQIYEDAFTTLQSFWENRVHIEARGWPAHLCYQRGVATVTSWQDFLARLQSLRKYSKAELDSAGIKPAYFHQESITFTLFDIYGSPVGFAVRDMRHGKVDGVQKYMNIHNNLVYDKRSLVYGLDRARHEQGPLNVVEGYADVMTAYTVGIWGTVAICGSKPTAEQIAKIEEVDKRDLVLALDHDVKKMPDGRPTGQGRTEDFLNEYVRGRRGVRVQVVDWSAVSPNGKMDMDTLLMDQIKRGLSTDEARRFWYQMPKVESFDWQLKILAEDMEPDAVVERMLPIIAAEPVHARQDRLVGRLATHTDIRRVAIERDLDALLDLKSRETRDTVQRITSKAMRDVQIATPEEAAQILQDAHSQVTTVVSTAGQGKMDLGSSLDMAQEVVAGFRKADPKMIGLKTGFPVFDKYMNGLCPGMWVFGGYPGHSKSSGVAQLSWNTACLNPDGITLVMTIDDSLEEWLAKYIALQTGFDIGHCVHPQRFLAGDKEKMARYEKAVANLMSLIERGRLEVRDATVGTTSFVLQKWVEGVRRRYPEKRIAVWLDNFHCLSDPGSDERSRFSAASKRIKLMSRLYDCFVGITAELVKNEDRQRPTKRMLKETGTIEYDATGIIMVHSELDADPDTTEVWHDPSVRDPERARKPIIKWYVDKNKNLYGVYKGVVRVQFNPSCSQLMQVENAPVALGNVLEAKHERKGLGWE